MMIKKTGRSKRIRKQIEKQDYMILINKVIFTNTFKPREMVEHIYLLKIISDKKASPHEVKQICILTFEN